MLGLVRVWACWGSPLKRPPPSPQGWLASPQGVQHLARDLQPSAERQVLPSLRPIVVLWSRSPVSSTGLGTLSHRKA